MGRLYFLLLIVILLGAVPGGAQQWKHFSNGNSGLISDNVKALAKDNKNKVYAGTIGGLSSYNNGIWQQLNVGNVSGRSIFGVSASSDSLWVGTEFNGLWGYFNNTWKNYDPNSSGNGIVGFGKDSRDSIYRLDKFGTFALWNGTAWTQISNFFSQPNNLYIDRNDNVWLLSNNTGMVRYKNGSFDYWQNNISPTNPGYMPSGSNFDMVQDSAGIYWIASNQGLLKFDGQSFQVFNTQNSGITSNRTRCLAIDSTGNLWIGTWDSGVIKYTGSAWVNYNVRNSPLTSPIINDVLIDSFGSIWIANGSNPFTSPSNGQGIYVLDPHKDMSNGMLPASPANLIGKVISVNQVIISWTDLSNNELGFELERSAKDSLHFEQIKFLIDNTTSFKDLTVNDTTYYYRIRAINSMGHSTYSNTIKVQPRYCVVNETSYGAYAVIKKVIFGDINKETPQCVAGYYDYQQTATTLFAGQTLLFTVSFDRCNITSDPIIGGVAYIDWNGNGIFTDNTEMIFSNLNINGKGEYSFPVTVPWYVVPGTTLRLRVRAEDDVYSTPISSCGYAEVTQDFSLQIINAPTATNPGAIEAKAITSRKIQLSWQDNASAETGYSVERSLDSIGFSTIALLPPNSIRYTDTILQPGTKYYYRITANFTSSTASSPFVSTTTLSADFVRQLRGNMATDVGFNTGAYWGDYNNDGKYDLYAPGYNRLYANQDSVLNNSNLPFHSSSSAAWADYDNDGDQDIYVTDYLYGGGPIQTFLYDNNGNGTFTQRSIFTPDGRINNCVWTDYNKDGFLDLYVSYLDLNYGKLYRNNKDKTFTMVKKFDNAGGYASFADYDNDGDDDLIIIGNSQSAIFKLSDSTFTRNTATPFTFNGNVRGISWADFDNDGDLDLFIPNSNTTFGSYSRLYYNNGNGNFSSYILRTLDGSAMGSAWGDYDNDGYQDLFVSRFQKTNKLFSNANGTLKEMPESIFVNEDFTTFPNNEMNSMGCAWADYDNDGFLDLYVAQSGYASRLYKNGINQNNWINLTLKGTVSNANAIGAMIKIKTGTKWQYRWIQSTSGFAGENSIAVEFGLGNASVIDSVIIRWPSGYFQELGSIPANQFLTITEPYSCLTNYWTGSFDNAWENAGNWSCAAVPEITSNVIIPSGSVVVLNSNVTINSLTLNTIANLTVSNGFTLTVLH